MKNWKTTSAGITSIVSGCVGLYFAWKTSNINEATLTGSITAIVAGIGLIFAHDPKKEVKE